MNQSAFNAVSIFVGTRFTLSSKKANQLVSFISALAISGLVLGVAILIVVVSVMNGFERELKDRILSVVPHVVFFGHAADSDWKTRAEALMNHDEVIEVSPFTQLQGMLHSKGTTRPIQILGFEKYRIPAIFSELLEVQLLDFPGSNQRHDPRATLTSFAPVIRSRRELSGDTWIEVKLVDFKKL